ncbi:hypothetical protein [Amycolatopsis sp. FDAARGOS 1241]|uniref:hypothetical protein n=1 Tax=Amycolatopsis sp. FDAARGOS 1241 TaxID=2778070 RepID=UPI00194E44F0|nr:hypothetical protein [Amycolatopsis sp. FDAARGOS 1241]QRP51378.1 hypothetical protein I6J71_17930 [Amycolatopsis sp. FDAARGOS 1241]
MIRPASARLMPNPFTTTGRSTAREMASNPSKKVPTPTSEASRAWNRPAGMRSTRAAILAASRARSGPGSAAAGSWDLVMAVLP